MRSEGRWQLGPPLLAAFSVALLASCTGCERTNGPDGGLAAGSPRLESCPDRPKSAVEDQQKVACLIQPLARGGTTLGSNLDAALYVDLSRSMQGFLTQNYSTQNPHEFRLVLDRIFAVLRPSLVYGYGGTIRTIQPSLTVAGDRRTYAESNSELEKVLPNIARDTSRTHAHIIIGDGRRTAARDAFRQYTELRETARTWVDSGGVFMVFASMIPFEPVPGDLSGCQTQTSAAVECALYAFAFSDKQSFLVILDALAPVFDRVFVWKGPTLEPSRVQMNPLRRSASVNSSWFVRNPLHVAKIERQIRGIDTVALTFSRENVPNDLFQKIVGSDTVDYRVRVHSLDVPAGNWREGREHSRVKVLPGGLVTIESYQAQARNLYEITVLAPGRPRWIKDFEAAAQNDTQRTFGLGRLFEGFAAENPQSIAFWYLLAN